MPKDQLQLPIQMLVLVLILEFYFLGQTFSINEIGKEKVIHGKYDSVIAEHEPQPAVKEMPIQ